MKSLRYGVLALSRAKKEPCAIWKQSTPSGRTGAAVELCRHACRSVKALRHLQLSSVLFLYSNLRYKTTVGKLRARHVFLSAG